MLAFGKCGGQCVTPGAGGIDSKRRQRRCAVERQSHRRARFTGALEGWGRVVSDAIIRHGTGNCSNIITHQSDCRSERGDGVDSQAKRCGWAYVVIGIGRGDSQVMQPLPQRSRRRETPDAARVSGNSADWRGPAVVIDVDCCTWFGGALQRRFIVVGGIAVVQIACDIGNIVNHSADHRNRWWRGVGGINRRFRPGVPGFIRGGDFQRFAVGLCRRYGDAKAAVIPGFSITQRVAATVANRHGTAGFGVTGDHSSFVVNRQIGRGARVGGVLGQYAGIRAFVTCRICGADQQRFAISLRRRQRSDIKCPIDIRSTRSQHHAIPVGDGNNAAGFRRAGDMQTID
ncbi:hypothetical protein D3C75_595700 [compost metagenome]